ncbi:MAG: PEP-CTERM sorting domain-containing protein [Trichodesmium sp. St16_bin4-tuft]|nr:PEP-CTERM sorting domain-containing protein [Trichodesmium sp. MAG_R01]MDE5074316.1 PEP-CTERM sorting domain-containing protein [Trichodesmium sp. St5_bin8]MDE5099818.1 PEP-CTERM sorting domain-containing protein [Trichodesmium sp. St16_bin4-tuft]MDE5104049.1 PEP-CTERM sorting domain-containing protein [Trichodesmium sp. St19_bin2]
MVVTREKQETAPVPEPTSTVGMMVLVAIALFRHKRHS